MSGWGDAKARRLRRRAGRPMKHFASSLTTSATESNTGHPGQLGQSIVEMALLLPVFVLLLLGILEFSIAFNAVLNLNYATRNASLLAAEAGNSAGSDCVILQAIETDLTPPVADNRVASVQIFWANPDGSVHGTSTNVYARTGSTTCTYPDGSTLTVPYTASSIGYPESSRCNVVKGCGASHPGLDTIGVTVTYSHRWVTPVASFIGGSGNGITLVSSNSMRMEPIL